ncbi:MAG: DUF1295 domain-containing protein [Clostridia bacterium]|nr:DUF1295 domain-containing protein [Clostridia bacterium]
MKQNRAWSFVIVALIYIAAGAVGYFVYDALPFAFWLDLLLADVAATVFTFIFSVILKNASVYDPYWSVAPVFIAVVLMCRYEMNLPRLLISLAVIGWGLRLTANWAYTFRDLTAQDWRYTMLHEKTGRFYPLINFVGIHLVPTLVVYACILPVVVLFRTDCTFNAGTVVFFLAAVGSFVMQGIADVEMHRFRKHKTGTFIRDGLWKYSRHPNYLGEICMWWSVGLLCVYSLGGQWWLLTGAVLNTCLFLFVSIPMAENHQRSRKPGFDEYKKQTRMLLPMYKKQK